MMAERFDSVWFEVLLNFFISFSFLFTLCKAKQIVNIVEGPKLIKLINIIHEVVYV